MREGEGAEEQRIDGAEDRGVGADSDREREHRDGGERWRAAEGAECEARVLRDPVEEGESSHGAGFLGEPGDVAEATTRDGIRIRGGELAARGVRTLHRVEREMEVHLLVELARVLPRARERAEPMPESIEE